MDMFNKVADFLLKDNPSENTQKETDLCNFVKGQLEEWKNYSVRTSSEAQWLTNAAYLIGFNGVYFDSNQRSYIPLSAAYAYIPRDRLNENVLLSRSQNRLARLTQNQPKYEVVPNSQDQDDKDAAALAVQVINHYWRKEHIHRKRKETVQGSQQNGHGYLHVRWDYSKGPMLESKFESVRQGKLSVEKCSAFEIFPDPNAKCWDECRKLIKAKIRPLSYFRECYGEKGARVQEESAYIQSLQFENRINNMSQWGGWGTDAQQPKNTAIEVSYYELPSDKFPNGRHIIVANNVVLKNGELPIDELPFVFYSDIPVEGKFYPESVITHARGLQDQLTRVINKRAEWTDKLLAGKYIAARGHGLIAESFTDDSGEVIEYDPVAGASEPHAMNIPSIPAYAYNEDDILIKKIDNIFGINDVAHGTMPSASIPAVGMQILLEQDQTRLRGTIESHEWADADLGRIILKFVHKYQTYEELLMIAGADKEYLLKPFVGSDLKGHTNAWVVAGSTMPDSTALKRNDQINLYAQGLLGNPQDPLVQMNVLDRLEYGDIPDNFKDISLDKSQIKRHIKMIESETMPPISEFDNHKMFLQELNRYRKGEKYERLSEISKDLLHRCMQMHMNEMLKIVAPDVEDATQMPDQSMIEPGLESTETIQEEVL